MSPSGDYRDPDRDRIQEEARRLFLVALERRTPEVLAALFEDVFPEYRKLWSETAPSSLGDPPWVLWSVAQGEWENTTAPHSGLIQALRSWAEAFFLDVPWFLDIALRTLWFWKRGMFDPQGEGTRRRFAAPKSMDFPTLESFTFRPWLPRSETRKEYEQEVMRALTEFLDLIEGEKIPEEWEKAKPVRKSRFGHPLSRQLEWLAFYQVRRLSYREVAREMGVGNPPGIGPEDTGRSTVARGVKEVARLIDLPIRPGARNQYR